MSRSKCLAILTLALALSGCAIFNPPPPGIGKPVGWSDLPGWESDRHAEAWAALGSSCLAVAKRVEWEAICAEAAASGSVDDDQARLFFERWFVPHQVAGEDRRKRGLITGYYEPLLFGSRMPSARYRYPLYGRPDDLLIIDLGERFPELKKQRLRGRLTGNRVVPYYSREEIVADRDLLDGNELLWLDDPNDLFFLHIQGSGRVQLDDGTTVGVGYSDQNGQPYRAIGKDLVERGEMAVEDVTLFSIKDWLRNHPGQAEELLNANPSFVFFVLRDDPGTGPVGSLNVPLTAERSIAIDPRLVKLGVPIWLDSHYPQQPDSPLQRLVFAQDTGGAIKGSLRADFFWGHGEQAERAAGTMKSSGRLWVLLPKGTPDQTTSG